jgi:hypothetical protein
MVPDRKSSDDLFASMDKNGDGIVTALEIIQEIRRIVDVWVPPKVMVNASMNQSMVDYNSDEYFATICKIQPRLGDDDCFDRFQMKGK